ncbi:hypothetical protein J1N35_041089, partial [Gossypium stocksii]
MSSPLIVSSPILGDTKNVEGFAKLDTTFVKNAAITMHYKFDTNMKNVTRLSQTKSIMTINNLFPGPRIIDREGDRLVIKVVNHVQYNTSLHWYETNR